MKTQLWLLSIFFTLCAGVFAAWTIPAMTVACALCALNSIGTAILMEEQP